MIKNHAQTYKYKIINKILISSQAFLLKHKLTVSVSALCVEM